MAMESERPLAAHVTLARLPRRPRKLVQLGAALAVTRLTIHPGKSGERHRHPGSDEVLILIRGNVRVHTPTEDFMVQPGDGLTILGGLTHQIENVGDEDADMVLVYSSGDRKW